MNHPRVEKFVLSEPCVRCQGTDGKVIITEDNTGVSRTYSCNGCGRHILNHTETKVPGTVIL